MFVNMPNTLSSPIIAHRDVTNNPDYGEQRGESVNDKLSEDSMIDFREMQSFLFMMLTTKIKHGSAEGHHKHSVDIFV